jgi:hypothetical protein
MILQYITPDGQQILGPKTQDCSTRIDETVRFGFVSRTLPKTSFATFSRVRSLAL